MSQPISVSVQMDAASFHDFAAFDLLRHRKAWHRPLVFTAILLVSAGFCLSQVGQKDGAALLTVVLAVVALGVPAVYFWTFFHSLSLQIKKMGLPRPFYRLLLDDETAASTRSAQALLDLPETGVADAETWTAVEALSLQLAAVSPNPDRDAGQADVYPGRAMKEGSVGPDVGQIEQWLNGRYMRNCGEDYVTENFRFGPKETEGVRAAQERADLLVTGTVNEETWAALRAQSCECEEG